jgi:glutathione S-transferase
MIVLHGSRARFGLPSASQFVTKAEILLKMAGLPYTHVDADFRRAPKGKIPFIEWDGKLLGDSELIRLHVEERLGMTFDASITPAEQAVGRAFAVMCEEHLYWGVVHARWMDKANFEKGPKQFFNGVPAMMRPFVLAMVNRQVKRNLYGQGLGRHTTEDMVRLVNRDTDAIAAYLADKPWLLGAEPSTADASVWPAVASLLCRHFDTPLRTHAERHANLVSYRDRGMKLWFPELARAA